MYPSKILIWNVRGLNSVARQDSVCTLVDASRADIVCIQETKMLAITNRVILSALGSDFSNFSAVPAVGASGGILVACRRHIRVTDISRIDYHSVTIRVSQSNGQHWWLTCVYGFKETMLRSNSCKSCVIFDLLAQVLG
jgi:hypothetical protein